MDEPTSGLDARAAAIVMRVVKNIADTGRTIVCTIHQPSINIFEAFDEVLNILSCSNDEQDLLNILGTVYIFVLFLGIANCSSVQSFIATDRGVVLRERFAGMYSSLAHSLAQVHNY